MDTIYKLSDYIDNSINFSRNKSTPISGTTIGESFSDNYGIYHCTDDDFDDMNSAYTSDLPTSNKVIDEEEDIHPQYISTVVDDINDDDDHRSESGFGDDADPAVDPSPAIDQIQIDDRVNRMAVRQ